MNNKHKLFTSNKTISSKKVNYTYNNNGNIYYVGVDITNENKNDKKVEYDYFIDSPSLGMLLRDEN